MDLIEKMLETTENVVAGQTQFKKVDFSLGEATDIRSDYAAGFAVKPTTLTQVEGGVGYLFFEQGFRLSLFEKIYKKTARAQLFKIYEQLAKVFQKLYTIRVVGDNYQVVNIKNVEADEPAFDETFVKIDINFVAHYRMTGVF